jgi:hypothetical protein
MCQSISWTRVTDEDYARAWGRLFNTTVEEPVKVKTNVPRPVEMPVFKPVEAPARERELVPVKQPNRTAVLVA